MSIEFGTPQEKKSFDDFSQSGTQNFSAEKKEAVENSVESVENKEVKTETQAEQKGSPENSADSGKDERKKWLKWRQSGIGSSDASAIHGESEWATPLQVYNQKLADDVEEKTSWALEKGNEFEPKARTLFAAQYNIDNETDETFDPVLLTMPELPFMLASLDGASRDRLTNAEFKFQGADAHNRVKDEKLPIKGGRVPLKYWIQMQHQMLVSGAKACYFVSYNPKISKTEVNTVRVERDEKFMAAHIKICTQFWEMVTTKTPPKESDRDFKMLKVKGLAAKANKYAKAKEKKEQAEAEMELLKAEIMEHVNHPLCRVGSLKIQEKHKQGAVELTAIPGIAAIYNAMSTAERDTYRKKGTTYHEFRVDKKSSKKTEKEKTAKA